MTDAVPLFRQYINDYSMAYHAQRPLVGLASREVHKAVRRGELKPIRGLSCVDCSKPAQVYDHRDYTRPLDVEPVCLSCNRKRGPGHPYIGATVVKVPGVRARRAAAEAPA